MHNRQRFLFLVISIIIVVTTLCRCTVISAAEGVDVQQKLPIDEVVTVVEELPDEETTDTTESIEEETERVQSTDDNSVPEVIEQETMTTDEDDFDLFCRLVYAEAGSDFISDHAVLAVATVIMNRVSDSRFPNTVRGVIYQSGQYSPVWTGAINNQPTQRVIDLCKLVWEGHREIPENVVWQAGFYQGQGVYEAIYVPELGTTIYLCY